MTEVPYEEPELTQLRNEYVAVCQRQVDSGAFRKNSFMLMRISVELRALVKLLVNDGVFTEKEYLQACIDSMVEENGDGDCGD